MGFVKGFATGVKNLHGSTLRMGGECGEQGRECKKNKNEEVRKKYIFIENV